ncbi:HVA1 family protein [Pleurocapsales cyanobacterium LEGE 10410]|nr:HVA1 family protein [Pleurocapsales cyanobacterium LEGE 10410]
MATKIKSGDRVKWKVGKGETTGKVTKKITESTTVDGKKITATKNKPRYLVENDNTGNVSAHRAKSLSPVKDTSDLKPKQQEILEDFQQAVNMDASEIKKWLKTEESHSVGQKDQNGKIKGRKSGKKIVKILQKDQSDYKKKDFKHMKKVISYVHRHLAQQPSGDVEDTPWRYSLMNWGNDPLKDK